MGLNCHEGDVALIYSDRGASWATGALRLVKVIGPVYINAEGRPTWAVYPVVMAPWVYNLPWGNRLACTDDAMLPLRPAPGSESTLEAALQDILLETIWAPILPQGFTEGFPSGPLEGQCRGLEGVVKCRGEDFTGQGDDANTRA